jgi:hypothetical protein
VYGIDLAAAMWGPERLPLRRVRSLLVGIPRWETHHELLTALVELTHTTNRFLHVALFKPPHPDPLTIPRPGQPAPIRKPRQSSPEDVRRFFGSAVRVVP